MTLNTLRRALVAGLLAACPTALALAASSSFAPMAAPAPPAVVHSAPPAPPATPDPSEVSVVLQPAGHDQVMVVGNSGGATHAMKLKIENENGHVTIEGDGDATKPWLGVLLSPQDGGYRITGVMDGSPADKAGLKVGDVIRKIDGRSAMGEGELLGSLKPGDTTTVTIERDGATRDIPAKVAGQPARMEFKSEEGMAPFAIAGDVLGDLSGLESLKSLKGLPQMGWMSGDGKDGTAFWYSMGGKPRLGVEVQALSSQLAKFFGTEEGKGVLVQDVHDGSAAEKAGMKAGDVILRIGSTDISDVSDIRKALQDVRKGETAQVDVLRKGESRTLTVEMDTEAPDPKQGALMPGCMPQIMIKRDCTPGCQKMAQLVVPQRDGDVSKAMESAREALVEAEKSASKTDLEADIQKAREALEQASRERARVRTALGPGQPM